MAADSDIIQIELAFQQRNKERHVFLFPIIKKWLDEKHFHSFDLLLERLNYYRFELSSITQRDNKDIQQLYRLLKQKDDNQITPQEHFILGLIYDYGLGDNQPDQTEALKHYQHAADNGVVPAIYLLGNLKYQIDGNMDNAYILWSSAAQKNFAISLTQLGDIAIKSDDKNVQKQAAAFYESAAHNGDRVGYLGLANYYLNISKDYQLARKFAESAAKNGCLLALSHLKIIHEKGLGVTPNNEIASHYFELLLKQAPIRQYDLKKLIQQFLTHISYTHNGKTYTESLPDWALDDEKEKKIRKGLCSGYVFMIFRAALTGDIDHFLKRLGLLLFLDDQIIYMAELYSKYRLTREKIVLASLALLEKTLCACINQTDIIKAKEEHQLRIERQTLEQLKLDDIQTQLLSIAKDFYIFISSLLYAQSPEKIPVRENGHCITQNDFIEILNLLPSDKLIKIKETQSKLHHDHQANLPLQSDDQINFNAVKKVFNFAFVFIKESELTHVITRSIVIGDMVVIGNGSHKIYFSYSKAGYFLYDPSAENFLILDSCHELVFYIKYFCYTRLGHDDNHFAIGINAYACIHPTVERPTATQLIQDILLQRGNNAQLEAKDCNDATSLYIAIYYDSNLVIEELLRREVNANTKASNSWTGVHIAASFGNANAIRLLAVNGAELNSIDKNGFTPLYFALFFGHLNVVKVFAERKCDFTLVDHNNHWNALHYAIFYNQIDIVSFIIQEFPELFKKTDKVNYAPLLVATSNNNLNMIIHILSLLKNLNVFSTSNIDELHTFREKLVNYFIDGIKAKRDPQQKLEAINAVLNKQNALGHFFYAPTNRFLFAISIKSNTGCIDKIMVYRNELLAEINQHYAPSVAVHNPSMPSPRF